MIGASTGTSNAQSTQPALPEEVSDLVNRVRHGNVDERAEAFGKIAQLETLPARAALFSVMDTADEGYAATACRELLTKHSDSIDYREVAHTLEQRSNYFRALVLESCLLRPPDSKSQKIAQSFAQTFARNALENRQKSVDSETCETVGVACLIASESTDQNVADLLRGVAKLCPQSRRVWLALARADAAQDESLEKARQIFVDDQLPPLIRIAAATAAAPRDPKAEAFVLSQMDDFVARFKDKDPGVQLLARHDDPDLQQSYKQFREGIQTMASLRYLKSNSAREAAHRYATAENEALRDIALLTICLRWPELFLNDLDKFSLDPPKVDDLLAVIALYHGNRGKTLIENAGKSLSDESLSRLSKVTLAGLFPRASSVVLGL
jgi:hypothetical protein